VANYAATFDPGVLSTGQQRLLLEKCRKHTSEGLRDYAMVLCMHDLGLRRSEVAHLRLADPDLAHGVLTVPAIKGGNHVLKMHVV